MALDTPLGFGRDVGVTTGERRFPALNRPPRRARRGAAGATAGANPPCYEPSLCVELNPNACVERC